jgi:AAA family ATPase
LKYITGKQVAEVPYEGRLRRFILASVVPKKTSEHEVTESLARGLESLSLHATPQIWLVTWDTEVLITGSDPEEEPQVVHKVRRF